MYFVYILQSKKDGKRYIGYTSNLEKILFKHNSGSVKSTKNRIPLEIIYYEKVKDLNEARKRELKLKSLKGGDALKNILKIAGVV